MECLTPEKAVELNAASEAFTLFLYSEIKFGPNTLGDWAEQMGCDIPEEPDFKDLVALEKKISDLFAIASNNFYYANSYHKATVAATERFRAESYKKIANTPVEGKRRTTATLEAEVEDAIAIKKDNEVYASIVRDFWDTQLTIIKKKSETLKNLFWSVKAQFDSGNGV